MKKCIVIFFVLMITLTVTTAHAQHQLPDDKVKTITAPPSAVMQPGIEVQAVPIPTIPIPNEAKMRVWWPDSGYDYKMQNLFMPTPAVRDVYIWNEGAFEKQKDKK